MLESDIERLVQFCRALRDRGLAVMPSETVAAINAFSLIDSNDRDEVFLALRSVLTTSVDEFPLFTELFNEFWNPSPQKHVERQTSLDAKSQARRAAHKQTSKGLAFLLENWTTADRSRGDPLETSSASDIEAHNMKDLTTFGNEDLEQIARLARRIVKRLARNPSRRWKPVRKGRRVNLRRSLRQSLKTGGELVDLSYRQRKPKRTKLFVICDSGFEGARNVVPGVLRRAKIWDAFGVLSARYLTVCE